MPTKPLKTWESLIRLYGESLNMLYNTPSEGVSVKVQLYLQDSIEIIEEIERMLLRKMREEYPVE